MLRIEGLTVRYGSVTALRDLSMYVDAGEIVALIGPNGAGKSTTINSIMGLLRPAAGSITFQGAEIAGKAPETVARLGIGLVPEGRGMFGGLSVRENLLIGTTVRSPEPEVAEELRQMQERFPALGVRGSVPATKLSGGEQQQLAIARALLMRPKLLVLDEPTLGLAPLVVDELFRLFSELRDEGITILLVEQNAIRAAELADRTYVLRTGRVTLTADRDEIVSHPDLLNAYLGI